MNTTVKNFENTIVEYLKGHRVANLYILSDFYSVCCNALGLPHDNLYSYKNNCTKIRYHLNKLVNKGILSKKRIGTGFLGKANYGVTSNNIYFLTDNNPFKHDN